ncbi:hypothetical protein ACFZAE_17090 [Streptomyces scabiei]
MTAADPPRTPPRPDRPCFRTRPTPTPTLAPAPTTSASEETP